MKNIRLVIFDLDGTLVDAYPAITSSFNHAMQSLGYPARSPRVIRRAVGWGDEALLKPFIKQKDLARALRLYRNHHKTALLEGSRLFPKVIGFLNYLKDKGYLLAVASNRPTKFSRILIRHLEIDKYFDYVLCADKLKHGKPHPEILNLIRRHFSFKINQVIYVGDMDIDAQAGRRAGIKTVIVTTGSSSLPEIKKERPWRLIRMITGLQKIL